MAPPLLPPIPNPAYITIQAESFSRNKRGQHNFVEVSALCGDDPPKITDGYAKWNVIDRPLRQGVTVPAGFNPAQMAISLRLGIWDGRFNHGGWDVSADAAQAVETMVDDLHWMAGGNFEAGPSPIVRVKSLTGRGNNQTFLVPRQYWGVGWVINGGIEWGNSLRHRNGSRLYQEATFTLLGYTSLGGHPPPVKTVLGGGFFKTSPQIRTALGIAASRSSRSPQAYHETLARRILRHPRNNPCHRSRIKLERRSIHWQMPPTGLDVWVPEHNIW